MINIHESWELLKPSNEEYGMFEFEKYFIRINKEYNFDNIPKAVFQQWIHGLHKNHDTLLNYSWINYRNVEFKLCLLDLKKIENIYVIKNFRDFVILRGSYSSIDEFCCNIEDKNYWIKNGTWKVPPIILDVNSLKSKPPKGSDIEGPYQLVEGHSRLGYLHSMQRISELNKGKIADKHLVYVMSEK